jgi:hypothetical protein
MPERRKRISGLREWIIAVERRRQGGYWGRSNLVRSRFSFAAPFAQVI